MIDSERYIVRRTFHINGVLPVELLRELTEALDGTHYKKYEREQSSEDRAMYAAAEDQARSQRKGLGYGRIRTRCRPGSGGERTRTD